MGFKRTRTNVVSVTPTLTASGGGFTPKPNASFFASYGTSVNADYSTGSPTGTANGVATVSGSKLQLVGNGYVSYSPVGNADSAQTGTIRFNHIPNYSGAPGTPQSLVFIGAAGYTNAIEIVHYTDGSILIYIYDSAGLLLVSIQDIGVYLPTSGTTYEIELNFDITGGAIRYFVDGVQLGTTRTNTGTRTSAVTIFQVGNSVDFGAATNNYSVTNLIVFTTVQHTADFTGEIPRSYSSAGYSNGTRLGTIQTLDSALCNGSAPGVLESLVITDSAKQSIGMDLFFFRDLPTIVTADQTTLDIPAAALSKCIGSVSVAAGDYKSTTSTSVATLRGLGLVLENSVGGTSIYVVVKTLGAPVYAANSLTFRYGVLQD